MLYAKKIWFIQFSLVILINFDFANAGILVQTLTKYQNTPMVEAQIGKSIYTELLNKTKKQSGKIYLSKDKIKIEFIQPEKEMLLFDGSVLWTVQYLPEELGGTHQVGRTKIDKKNRSQILIGLLFDKSQFKKFFRLDAEKVIENQKFYTLSVLNKDLKIDQIKIVLDKSKKEISSISYFDDLKNKIEFNLNEQQFHQDFKKETFKYTPPKNAQVTNL